MIMTHETAVSIEIVGAESANEISHFIASNSTYQRDIPFWTWLHKLWSVEDSISVVGKKGGIIIAHYAIIIQNAIIEGTTHRIGLGLHALVDKDFRKQISISDVSAVAYDAAEKCGLSFIYGFPNKNYRLIQEKIERWSKVSLFSAFELDNRGSNPSQSSTIDIEVLKSFDYFDYNVLHQLSEILEVSRSSHTKIKKGIQFYENRYLRHPQGLYDNLILRKSGRVEGLLILKKYKNLDNGEVYGHIVDFLISDNISLDELIETYLSYYSSVVDRYISWRINPFFEKRIKTFGFKNTGFDTFFAIKFLNIDLELKKLLCDFDKWELFMGDSDAF
jgi:hypothetical protein